MDALAPIVTLHACSGAIALASFWCAAVLRKGSPRHRLAGRLHLLGMLGVILTGIPMAAHYLVVGRGAWAAFFTQLLVLVSTSSWLGWRAIRDRDDARRYLGPAYRVLEVLNPLVALAVLAIGITRGLPLLIGFPVVGLLVGFDLWNRRRQIPHERRWWLREHYGAMIGNGAATHIAFLAIGLPRVAPELVGGPVYYAAWFAPLGVALAVRIWLDRRHAIPAVPARVPATP